MADKVVSKRQIWHPPEWDKADAIALQTLAAYASGAEALPPSAAQCQRVLDWIVYKAASTYDEPFRPGQPDVRDYMLGRRSVGLAIVKLLKIKIGALS